MLEFEPVTCIGPVISHSSSCPSQNYKGKNNRAEQSRAEQSRASPRCQAQQRPSLLSRPGRCRRSGCLLLKSKSSSVSSQHWFDYFCHVSITLVNSTRVALKMWLDLKQIFFGLDKHILPILTLQKGDIYLFQIHSYML